VASVKALFDTNILIDYLNGVGAAAKELARHDAALISRITWMEVLAGVRLPEEEDVVRLFLHRFRVVELDERVAIAAIALRKERGLKLPDAIILASALTENCKLLTRNTGDFDPVWPEIHVPYRLSTGKSRAE